MDFSETKFLATVAIPARTTSSTFVPDPRDGFALGWDYAAYGLELMPDAEPDLMTGFKEGQKRFARRTLSHDRYVRKWLVLRHNAWRRGRVFDAGVTPQYLESITPRYCPITRVELTVGTGADSDCSVDRLENLGGYAPGNLVVLSVRANEAKAAMGYCDVLRLLQAKEPAKGLSAVEWARMAALMGMAADEESVLPLLVMPPRRLNIRNRYSFLQMASMMATYSQHYAELAPDIQRACPGKSAKKAFEKLLDAAGGHITYAIRQGAPSATCAIEDSWRNGDLLRRFRAWVSLMSDDGLDHCLAEATRHLPGIRRAPAGQRQTWALETRGYIAAH